MPPPESGGGLAPTLFCNTDNERNNSAYDRQNSNSSYNARSLSGSKKRCYHRASIRDNTSYNCA